MNWYGRAGEGRVEIAKRNDRKRKSFRTEQKRKGTSKDAKNIEVKLRGEKTGDNVF